ncbi:aminoglycoside phosphotransferase family protein [Chitinophaga nivalis]|uniref:Aminoglycoside phosphotransferase family protein n=1 Tax=Chitinophaga nivalis TaxID=2991709 RepID=A0ABT3IKH6_9BACT|nr:aminoglycoside phosphotransferase family protein [Chitinophaga nivalis]MCW3465834.1 aminoglycoside phosphotransferase family protein [Chitinophaga nivalis]MCW3484475.1 aminoglycoside phosphotransferase family protein [Chitinophaga nivalis]
MATQKMHAEEADTSIPLVKRLLQAQLPQWAQLPVEEVHSAGTVNAIYRLGADRVIRLPRIEEGMWQVEKEHHWLPVLAPLLPLTVPVPLVKGAPGEGFPWSWSVYQWIAGDNATITRFGGDTAAAVTLANFVNALQQIDPGTGPGPGTHNFFRGVPLATRDAATREAIRTLSHTQSMEAVTAVWDQALSAPVWDRSPVWIHGDLHGGNLLATEGRLSAVIDFGGLGVGDPACDLLAAWMLFTAPARAAFRATVRADEATWQRGRGWALSVGLIALPYYEKSNPVLAAMARHAIREAVADYQV